MRRVLAMALFVLLVTAGSARTEGGLKKYNGKLKSVNLQNGSFVLVIAKKDVEFRTNPDTKFYGPDKKAAKRGLSDKCFQPDTPIMVIGTEREPPRANEVWCGTAKPEEKR
jgi:hypothetical protein